MSRVAKLPVRFSDSVAVSYDADARILSAKGRFGAHVYAVPKNVPIKCEPGVISVEHEQVAEDVMPLAGTVRAHIANLIEGVSNGFTVILELRGVGYRVQYDAKDRKLVFKLGYSHDVEFIVPADIKAECTSPTVLQLQSHDKDTVKRCAAKIRSFRAPDNYKGKGIRFQGERVRIKEISKKK